MHNVEKSTFRKGQYVGYGVGGVWHITKSTSSFGTWCARCRDDQQQPTLFAFRLRDISAKLDTLTWGAGGVASAVGLDL